jgi:type VI secretion system protein ImpF
MSRAAGEVRLAASVLDRLLDDDPRTSREPLAARPHGLRHVKQSVKRDLEWLLNTRRSFDDAPGLDEARTSVLAYGLPDFTAVNVTSPADQTRMRREIEATVAVFEPRLQDVSVTLEPAAAAASERVIRFRIDARLRVEPAPEPVSFDMVLQLDRREFRVEGR